MEYEVKNWRNFQHYKNRNPPWIKLHFEIFTSRDWVMLADASKLLAVVCMLLASRNEGVVPSDNEYIKRVAHLDGDIDLTPLIDIGFLIPSKQSQANASTKVQANASTKVQANAIIETEAYTTTEAYKERHIKKVETDAENADTKKKTVPIDAWSNDHGLKGYLQIFREAYRQAVGSDYTVSWGRDLKQLKAGGVISTDEETFRLLCIKFFAPSHAFKGNCDVPSFVKAINRLKIDAVPDFSRQRMALAGLNLKEDK